MIASREGAGADLVICYAESWGSGEEVHVGRRAVHRAVVCGRVVGEEGGLEDVRGAHWVRVGKKLEWVVEDEDGVWVA